MKRSPAPKTKRGLERREQILRAAEQVIGEQGFSAASIADITRAAGTALGTFYIYFKSKEEVFRELVLEMGQLTRTMVAEEIARAPNRLEAERAGLRAFLRFVQAHPALYRVVEEARFVDPEAYRSYFTGFARAYERQLSAAVAEGQISPGDAEVRAWALMGIAKTLGERFVLWEETPDIDRVADAAFAMIERGLRP
jgi:AcrR family transcriptional regulator